MPLFFKILVSEVYVQHLRLQRGEAMISIPDGLKSLIVLDLKRYEHIKLRPHQIGYIFVHGELVNPRILVDAVIVRETY